MSSCPNSQLNIISDHCKTDIVLTTQKKQVGHKAVNILLHRRQNPIRQGLQICDLKKLEIDLYVYTAEHSNIPDEQNNREMYRPKPALLII